MRAVFKCATGFCGAALAAIAGALIVVAATWTLVAERARYEERDAVNGASVRSAALALAFEQQVSRTLQAVDQAVRFARHEHEEHGERLNLRRILDRLDPRDYLYAGIVDARGMLILSSSATGPNVADREYFVEHRDDPRDRLRVGTPVVSRSSGQPSIQFTRRISGPRGEFLGVVVLGMAPAILADASRHIDVGATGQVVLVGFDGISRARRIGAEVTAGHDARESALLAHATRESSGSYLSLGRFDATPRYMSYRVLREPGLIAAVGLSAAEVLAPARERARTYYAAAAAATVLTVLAAGLLLTALWRRNQALAERERLEARHRAELMRFRATLDLSSDAIYIVSRRTMTIVDTNETACRALDRRREELIGAEPHLVFTNSSVRTRADLERIYDRLIAGPRRSESVERTHRRKDGKTFPVEIQRSAVQVGGEWYVVAIARDISARRAAEQALRESEARYRSLAEFSPDAILVHSDYELVFVNRAMCELLGARDSAQLVGKPATFMLAPGNADPARGRIAALYAGKAQPRAEQAYRRLDGRVIDVEIAAAPVSLDGRPAAHVTVRDISERKAAERALLERNARLAKQQEALSGVAKSELLDRGGLDGAIRHLTEVAAAALGVARVSYWRLQEEGGSIHCADLFEDGRHSAGLILRAADYPSYFTALGRNGLIAAEDAHADPRTAEFSAGYLASFGIGAMLDVPVFVGGRPDGVLCHEHVGGRRTWHSDEQLFASAIGGLVSLAVERAERLREERLARMEHDITRCLAGAGSISSGLQEVLATLCEAQSWEAARFYAQDEDARVLRFQQAWTIADARYEGFNQASRGITFQRGVGMGGLVWESGEAMWVPDVTRDARVVNRELARSGIRSAFVFPVTAGADTIGIVATFSRDVRAPDERLLRGMRAIGAQIGQFVERKRAQERADHLAQFDSVTELPNRNLYYDRLAQTLTQAQRHSWNVGVLFCDVDFFKKVNDTLGHAVGDRLLQDIAKRLAVAVRPGDTVARIGGDEFAVIAADLARPQDAALVAEKLVECLRLPFSVDGHEVFATGSFGIAVYPQDGRDGVTLMKNADAAMSRAKELGRNSYQFYAAEMNERALENLQLQNDLRRALERNEFRLHFQPKAELRSGRITGFEALLRWERPGQGLVSPAVFIPLLEETGLIIPVGAWVIRAACAQIDAWRRSGHRALPVAVNLAAKQLAQPDLAALIDAALQEHGVEPCLLELEVTESDAMQSPEQCIATLARLRARGVAVSIDDFGTGYSSLSYLKRMPVVALKLDRSFVKDLPANAEDASITRTVIALAHSLGLKVVAEGVETGAQRDFLAGHGCDQMQGYLLSRPLPAEQCSAMLPTVLAAA